MEYSKSVKTRTRRGSSKIAVLGIGNLLLKDEGIGVHVVQKLADIIKDKNIKMIDAGTHPDFQSLIDEDLDKLIIVDALKAGDKPGTIYKFSSDEVGLESEVLLSVHDIGVVNSLRMLALWGKQPKSTVVIGIEPETIDFELELSPEIDGKQGQIIDLVLREIRAARAVGAER